MCGFSGIVGKNFISDNINSMTSAIKHRGPSNTSYFNKENISLGFVRLSIIDLNDRSNQPMIDENTGVVIVFNGEIYNYKELRNELKSGYEFTTESDTEVVLKSYLNWGEDFVNHLRGMFAIAIVDGKKLVLTRDHFGIKPLYYGYSDNNLYFSSELKGILANREFNRKLNTDELFSYLELQHMAGDSTFVKNINRLPYGSIGVIEDVEATREIKIKKYFKFEFTDDDLIEDEKEAVNEIKKALVNSVNLHKNADVDLGCFLSGGIDSSLITALSMPKTSFSVGFSDENGKFDESGEARALSKILGIENRTKIITEKEVLENLRDIVYYLDEPQANLSSIPLYFLSELARREVTVVLSGEGSDEIFGGYESYLENGSLAKYQKLPKSIRKLAAGLSNILPNSGLKRKLKKGSLDESDIFIGEANIASRDDIEEILDKKYLSGYNPRELTKVYFNDNSILRAKQLVDLNFFMQKDILLKGDRMSMAHSLELRVPFLDLEVWNVARRLSDDLKIRGNVTKFALREAARDVLPEEWYNRPKKGFPVPMRHWLRREDFYNEFKEVLTSSEAGLFFNREKLFQLLDEHYEGKNRHHRKLYSYYVFLLWYERSFK